MKQLKIRRPEQEDIPELHHFFRTVVTDTFMKEGIGDLKDDMEEEIQTKMNYLESDLKSNGKERFFLLAVLEEQIVGTIEYGPASNLIITCTNHALKDLNEVGTVFVHPEFQRMGIGNALLRGLSEVLLKNEIQEICLDSGYRRAQQIWIKKYGNPDYFLKDYWGEGFDHMIWRVKTTELSSKRASL
ncbi:GNAT family N-acetyltransferase [Bacillus carboniphilus]|uniref:GNAT family N-acetyltransferase n=1 Tax=Bacillus carboniphilus TaxID=86663 RepID=A0ABN0WIW8_9BACI